MDPPSTPDVNAALEDEVSTTSTTPSNTSTNTDNPPAGGNLELGNRNGKAREISEEAAGTDSSSVGQRTAQEETARETGPSESSHRLSNTPQGETWVDFLRSQSPGADSLIPETLSSSNPSRQEPQPSHIFNLPHRELSGSQRPPSYTPTQESHTSISPAIQSREEFEEVMADRKRRLTAPDSAERRSGHGPSQPAAGPVTQRTTMASRLPPGTVTAPIDLTASSPPPRFTPRPHIPSPPRRGSDFILPKWQPDSEVSACPVCKKPFTFFNRKHHCRKCGRVVCASCSPHRITIPRQFIVHPPALPTAIIDLTGDPEEESEEASPPRQVWGGEEVRVCNPCVPDPNLSPPPQRGGMDGQSSPPNWNLQSTAGAGQRPSPRRHTNSARPLPPQNRPHQGHRSTMSDAALQDAFRNRHIAFTNPSTVRDLWPPTAPPPPAQGSMYPPRTSSTSGAPGVPPPPYRYRSLLDITTPMPPQPPQQQLSTPRPPRRVMAEEDECPICGNELPLTGPNGETAAREAHVADCIDSHSYASTPPPRTHSAPGGVPTIASANAPIPTGPSTTSTSISTTAPSSSLPPAGGMTPSSYASASGTQRQRRMTGGRMLVYDATEKDCVGEDGEANECVICFEEFAAGDEMGRLECLCRFHRSCIRQWWDTKGVGSCPTHQLHD
ncbi:FYVE-domain-containing protein [Tothia fuscella]|uniref:FYVE-domain-containing protein n=1 Tax=Tothia fuscella TaxID=1048955 RepID=A0A9P4P067_9PEZI|nr:FYVE-domain-containing protein [Tothia fuscella]